MSVKEKINIPAAETHETEVSTHTDTLRHSLLSSSEAAGGFVIIPRNTIAVEMNSGAIQEESFAQLSGLVEKVQEESPFESSLNLQKRGYGRMGIGNFMSSIDYTARRELKKDESSPNLTFLYDGSHVDMDGKTFIPSAILVHEELSELQIRELRDKLPAGVPLIDGKTNMLLDEVGQAEREQGRHHLHVVRGVGHSGLSDLILDIASTMAHERKTANFFDWDAAEDEFPEDDQEPLRGRQNGFREEPLKIPESPEVQNYAKAQEIIAEKTGGRNWDDLAPAEQRSVRRRVTLETHPDREGGDAAVFRAAQAAMTLKPREKSQ